MPVRFAVHKQFSSLSYHIIIIDSFLSDSPTDDDVYYLRVECILL